MVTIGVSIIAHNEEAQLKGAIESAAFADEIVVVDCESSDSTAAIAKSFERVKLFSRPNNPNLNVNKSFGFEQLTTDWIFYLDPDERITPALAAEIRKETVNSSYVAYKIPRRNYFFGKWLAHGGQYPDTQLRLFKRGKARFPNKHVHESLMVDGKTGRLNEHFDHFPYLTLDDYLRKMNFYTSFQASFWHSEGLKADFATTLRFFFMRPSGRFLRRYLLKLGWLDGWQGYVAALGDAFQTAISYGKFLEKQTTFGTKNS